ncbi:MAG: ubiquinol-cytochrome c reductase iron-sulfur subunit [Actinomycetota bacterium]
MAHAHARTNPARFAPAGTVPARPAAAAPAAGRRRHLRRHAPAVLQPRHRVDVRPRPQRLLRLDARLPVAANLGRVRQQDPRRESHRHSGAGVGRPGAALCRRGPLLRGPLPRRRRVEGRGGVQPQHRRRDAPGVVALYQKCPNLGCRVPWCKTSQWFECPCHGSQYNRVGEKNGAPAPRGLDRFPVTVDNGVVVVDTSLIVQGPPIGTNTTGQEAEGPPLRVGRDTAVAAPANPPPPARAVPRSIMVKVGRSRDRGRASSTNVWSFAAAAPTTTARSRPKGEVRTVPQEERWPRSRIRCAA